MIGVLPKSEINELLAMAQADGLTLTDLARICQAFNIAPKQVLNELSVAVAGGYLDGSLAYEFCDDVMNGIINAVVEVSMTEDIPQPAFCFIKLSIKVNGCAVTTHLVLTPVRITRSPWS